MARVHVLSALFAIDLIVCSELGAPVSAFRPLGTSTARHGAVPACIRSSQCCICAVPGRAGSSVAPMPSRASIHRSNSCGGPAASATPAAKARWRDACASGGDWLLPAGKPVHVTMTSLPHWCRCSAASKPSPPLLPGPQAIQMRWALGANASARRATARPARCIKVWGSRVAAASCSIWRVEATLCKGWLTSLEIFCMRMIVRVCGAGGEPE